MTLVCPKCGARLRVNDKDNDSGKKIRCPKCSSKVEIESDSVAAAEKSASPSAGPESSRDKVILLAVLAAHVPMLLSYFGTLWQYEHFQFFPFALIACVLLFRRRIEWHRVCLTRAAWVLLGADAVLVGTSCLMGSPWIAAVGFACAVWALVASSVDRESHRRPWEPGLLFLSVIRPPAGYDIQLVQKLQLVTGRIASQLLDWLGVLHVRSGNLVELSSKRLFVEEACSGVQSLFAIVFLALLIVAVRRRAPLHAILQLAATPLCAVPMNIARVVSIALASEYWQVDWSVGTAHTVVGYILLGMATLLVLSADRCLRFFGDPISKLWFIRRDQKSVNPLIALWNWCWSHSRDVDAAIRRPVFRPVSQGVVAGAVLLCGWQCVSLFATEGSFNSSEQVFAFAELPDHYGSLELTSRESDERSRSNNQGQFSELWKYRSNDAECVVACDYPFSGWHALETCYTGKGWEVENKEIVGDDWPSIAVTLSTPTGQKGYLIYSFFDAVGKPVRPKSADDPMATIAERLMRPGHWDQTSWLTYQCQLFHTASLPPSGEARQDLLRVHQQSRATLLEYFQARGESGL